MSTILQDLLDAGIDHSVSTTFPYAGFFVRLGVDDPVNGPVAFALVRSFYEAEDFLTAAALFAYPLTSPMSEPDLVPVADWGSPVSGFKSEVRTEMRWDSQYEPPYHVVVRTMPEGSRYVNNEQTVAWFLEEQHADWYAFGYNPS